MIAVDIETSGFDFLKCGIWQIAAIDLKTKNQFFGECQIDNEDRIINDLSEKPVLEVIGKTEKLLRAPDKQSQKELLKKFFKWFENVKIKNCICQNPQFDLGFIMTKARKYGLKIPFHHRAFDLHSIASLKYFQIKGKFLIDKDHSGMGLSSISKFCGMNDERKVHNALEDARLEAECFSRLLYGKPLLDEYKKFPVQLYLK